MLPGVRVPKHRAFQGVSTTNLNAEVLLSQVEWDERDERDEKVVETIRLVIELAERSKRK